MSFDKSEFLALVKERGLKQTGDMIPAFRALAAAAPVMQSLLTGSDAWDRYLTYLQGYIDQAENLKAQKLLVDLANSRDWSDENMMRLKAEIMVLNAQISAWELAMSLPKELIASAELAREKLAKFDEETEKSTADRA